MGRKKLNFLLVVFLIIGIFFSSYLVGLSVTKEEKRGKKDELYKELDLFGDAMAVIERKYVEEKSAQDLIYGALKGMLHSLDSYSQFLTPEEYKELLVETEGKFGGLGMEITIKDGFLTVVSPLEDTPAWKAGIKPGDIIVKIDGELTKGITLNEAVKKLRGEPKTKVTLTVLREADRKLEDITIVRDIIKIKDIRRAVILKNSDNDDSKIGYIKIGEFRESTAAQLEKALAKLKKQGMEGLILDLRNNPGGLLSSAIKVASFFLEEGKVVVFTKSREGKNRYYKSIFTKNKYLKVPMVVLINKGSASGSEIVASALRDHKRAILLGENSFGKGSVQTIISLSDGSALRLTTAKFYSPLGKVIQEKGVGPDIVVAKEKITEGNKKKKDIFKELENNGKEEFDYSDDYQLLRAIDLIKGLLVLYP